MNSPDFDLPNSLNLPPHLSAQKYFFVCTLTVAAWDTLVLSPRTWRLFKTPGWPALKVLFHFLRIFMPLEFLVVGENIIRPLCSSPVANFPPSQLLHFSTTDGLNLSVYHLLSHSFLMLFSRFVNSFISSNLFVPLSCWQRLLVRSFA